MRNRQLLQHATYFVLIITKHYCQLAAVTREATLIKTFTFKHNVLKITYCCNHYNDQIMYVSITTPRYIITKEAFIVVNKKNW